VLVQDAPVTFVNVQGGPEGGPYRCPCCFYVTLGQRNYHEICPVTEARDNFRRLGASDERRVAHVRDALPAEHPPE
jgi:hypothetical protein